MSTLPSCPDHPDRSFPRLHPRPAKGWLNDPNGIHHVDGRWHVFFQYNPDSARHDRIVWGQVSSADLLNWTEEGIAIAPQPGTGDEFGCWTGVGVLDDGVPILLYSGVRDDSGRSEVMLARREGDRFQQSPHVVAPMPDDASVVIVRDPFVFEVEGRRWGIQCGGLASGEPAVLLYDAADLTSWKYQGLLLDGTDEVAATLPPANAWECPQLVPVGDEWVLIVSFWVAGELTGTGYLLGSLEVRDGLPRYEPRVAGLLDDGPSFYAPQAVRAGGADGDPERVLLWGWAREATTEGVRERSAEDADIVGWSGMLTSVRELVVDGDVVRTVPARELVQLRGELLVGELGRLRGESFTGDMLPDQAEAVLSGTGAAELRLAADGEPGQLVWRGELSGGTTRILLDASLIEVFPEGATSTTLRVYPADGESYRLIVGPGVRAEAWRLRLPE
ncbi:glycoside hydrolase family 32 protein [Tessaracoccus caeni]|uniref:glycoside hydrolase family 32 protein n=1 Tax=Tessaracoccus caeni TaxID=3031239 RepID=UPI0023DCCE38|nr:glycoside hydrolase family 32 protein [Tessaracoccus caeni]MDF1488023.1 glycoside hydrolase family 32 protein [Tessaracoccus caeni]